MVNKKELKCEICKKTFSKKSHLVKHAKLHKKGHHLVTKPMKKSKASNTDVYTCFICSEVFNSQFELEAHETIHMKDGSAGILNAYHEQMKGQKEKIYACDICHKTFPTKFKLSRHSYIHVDVKPFPCDRCGRRFSRKDHLQVHYRIHTGEKICYCMECGQGFNTTAGLHRHYERLHSDDRKTVICAECGLEFGFKAQLKRHYDFAHKTSYTCEFCGNISGSEAALYRHLRKHVLSEPYVCLMCSTTFTTTEDMAEHQCCPTVEDPYKVVVRVALQDLTDLDYEIDPNDEMVAQKLQRKFDKRGRRPKQKNEFNDKADNFDAFEAVQDASMTNNDDSSYTCKFCEKGFPSEADKLAHEVIHIQGSGSTTCSICKVKFSTSAKLIRHLRIHTGENPFPCKFCSKAFPHKSYLQRHMLNVHATDEETCPFCFRFCPTPEELAEHLRTHQDPKEPETYFCDCCDSFFSRHMDLQAHKQHAHSDNYCKCRYCQKSFYTKSAMLSHEQTCQHNDQYSDNDVLTIDEFQNISGSVPLIKNLHPCGMCEDSFSSFLEKIKHMKVVHKPAFYDCDLCPCKFVSSISLRNHRIAVHSDEELRRDVARFRSQSKQKKIAADDLAASFYHCKDCNLAFPSLEDFLEHAQQHTYDDRHTEELQCVLCDETFHSTEELAEHLQNHDDNMIVEVGIHERETEEIST